MREGWKSAEVVVATKSGESRMSEGPKNERTKLNEKLEPQTEESSEAAERGNCGHDSAGQASPRRCRRLKRCEREGKGRGSARLNTESNVRDQTLRPMRKPVAAFNRRMRKTARPVVWEGAEAQSSAPNRAESR